MADSWLITKEPAKPPQPTQQSWLQKRVVSPQARNAPAPGLFSLKAFVGVDYEEQKRRRAAGLPAVPRNILSVLGEGYFAGGVTAPLAIGRAATAVLPKIIRVPAQAPARVATKAAEVGGRALGAFGEWRNQVGILGRVFGEKTGQGVLQVANRTARNLGPRNVFIKKSGLLNLTEAQDANLRQVLEGRATPVEKRVGEIAAQLRTLFDEDAGFYIQRGARVRTQGVVRNPATGASVIRAGSKPFVPVPNYSPRMVDPRRVIEIPREELAKKIYELNAPFGPPQILTEGVGRKLIHGKVAGVPRYLQPQAQAIRSFLRRGDSREVAEQMAGVPREAAEKLRDYVIPIYEAVQPAAGRDIALSVARDRERALQIADALKAMAAGKTPPASVPNDVVRIVTGRARLPGHLHERVALEFPDEALHPMKEAVPIYIEQAAKERAFLEVFGPHADDAIEKAIAERGMRDPDIRLAANVWDQFRGRAIRDEAEARLGQKAGILNNIATATLLGVQTAVSQLSQYGMVIARLPIRNVARAAAQVAFRGGMRGAEEAGAFVDDLARGIIQRGPLMPTATKTDVTIRATSKLAGFVVKKSGIEAMDRFPRAVAYHAARRSLIEARDIAALGNRKAATRALARLREVGLDVSSSAREIDDAAVELAGQLNIRARPEDLPWVLQTSWGRFARGLNTFNIEVTKSVYRNVIQHSIKTRTPAPVLKFLGSGLILGEVIGDLRKIIAGRPDDRAGGSVDEFVRDLAAGRVPVKTIVLRATENLSEAATLGFAERLVDSLRYATSATETGARLVGSVVGAGLSSALETVGAAGVLAAAPFREGRGARTAARSLVRRTPLVGSPLAYRLFPSAVAEERLTTQRAEREARRGGATQDSWLRRR